MLVIISDHLCQLLFSLYKISTKQKLKKIDIKIVRVIILMT